jgi:hypothetical protein
MIFRTQLNFEINHDSKTWFIFFTAIFLQYLTSTSCMTSMIISPIKVGFDLLTFSILPNFLTFPPVRVLVIRTFYVDVSQHWALICAHLRYLCIIFIINLSTLEGPQGNYKTWVNCSNLFLTLHSLRGLRLVGHCVLKFKGQKARSRCFLSVSNIVLTMNRLFCFNIFLFLLILPR